MLLVQQKQKLVRRIKPFTMKNGELCKMGPRQQTMTMFDNNRSTDGDERTA